jgi:regulator of sigma E protease
LRPGDTIEEIDGHHVTQFPPPSENSITWRIITSEGTNIVIKYLRDGQEHMAYVTPYHRPTHWYERKSLRQILIAPVIDPIVDQPMTNSPAARAGLQHGDKIVAINGEKIISAHAVSNLEDSMTNGPTHPVTLTIRRGNQEFDTTLAPEKPLKPASAGPSFGIEWLMDTNVLLAHPTPAQQIRESAMQIVNTLGALFHKNDVGVEQLGGAVMIVRVYTKLFTSEYGWRQVIWFSVILNVNLALLNLLPFPVLDGGHILLALLEVIRRRPVSVKLLQYIQTGCAMVLIGFMLFIAFFDTGDWLRSARQDRQDDQPIIFAPKK